MRAGRPCGARARAGLTLVEVSLAALLFFLLTAALSGALGQLGALGRSGSAEGRLLLGAEDALQRIVRDLRQAGFVDTNGKSYPHLFSGGSAGAGFAPHSHTPAEEHAPAGHPAHGPDREIVFVQPNFVEVVQDAAGENYPLEDPEGAALEIPAGVTVVKRYAVPVIGADGTPGWSAREISYVLETAPDGVNELRRRVDGASPVAVARGVERLVFDTAATDPVGVPLNAVRVRLWLRVADEEGTWHERVVESIVRLRNGG
jgi:hypothetical protein